jgi:microcystin-dependent protein
MYLTDGTSYTVEMPLVDSEGNLSREVHYKSGGGGGGVVDLSGYVRRPSNNHDGKWQVYRETTDGRREWTPATTDLIETNGQLMFRDSKGRFAPTPEELDELTNQLKVNRWLWDRIQELDLKAGGVAISDEAPEDPENGMFWFDNSEDVMQLFIWHKDSDAWIPVAPPTTLEGRVSTGEATQQAIIAQIQESLVEQENIKNKVNALEGAVGDHSLVFTMLNANVREGEFNLKDGAMQLTNTIASADFITLSDTDRNGNPVDLDRITEGDVLRLADISGQVAELKIDESTNNVFAFTKISGELDRLSDYPYDFVLLSSFDPAGLATIDYVDSKTNKALSKDANNEVTPDFRIKGGGGTYVSTAGDELGLYHVKYPTEAKHAASKEYVDNKVASTGSGVPVGCIMIWMNSGAPDGWLKLQGGSFDVSEYPELHAYLGGTAGYTSGKLPDWSGHYPGEYGDHITDPLGTKAGHRTARPAGEAPYHKNAIPNGATRTFTATGGTNAYSNGTARPAITEGWDSTTRPNTVVVHYIIKAKP